MRASAFFRDRTDSTSSIFPPLISIIGLMFKAEPITRLAVLIRPPLFRYLSVSTVKYTPIFG